MRFTLATLAIVTIALWEAGCSSSNDETAAGSAGASSAQNSDPEIDRALAQLTPADRTLAEQQSICPITEKPLGSMGTPIKLTVEGQEVFICCAGCEQELRANPDQYLSRLDDQ